MKSVFSEIRATAKLGTPLVLAQLTTMAMAVTDAVIVGRGVGTEALAAMAFALNFMNMPCIGLYGFSSATSVLVAHGFGAGQFKALAGILRNGLFLSLSVALAVVSLMILLFWNLDLVNYLGQPKELIPIGKPYILFYGAAFIFQLCAGNCRAFCESQNRPWLAMYVVLFSIVLNALLDYTFVFGLFGLPKMGLVGAGLATLICSIAQFVILLFVIIRNGRLNLSFADLRHFTLDRPRMRKHLSLGIPTCVQIGLEISSMSILALLVGRFGAETLAAHHVTIQIICLAFMVPLGMSFAVSIRVSQAAGAGDRALVHSICGSSMLFAVAWSAVSSALFLIFRKDIPRLFTEDQVVIGIVSTFLIVGAVFQLVDSVQCTAMGALRGLRDVKAPMLIAMLCHWVLSLPLAWFLCFTLGLGGIGVWIAMATALSLISLLLYMRLSRVSKTCVLQGD